MWQIIHAAKYIIDLCVEYKKKEYCEIVFIFMLLQQKNSIFFYLIFLRVLSF